MKMPPMKACRFCWRQIPTHGADKEEHRSNSLTCLTWQRFLRGGVSWGEAQQSAQKAKLRGSHLQSRTSSAVEPPEANPPVAKPKAPEVKRTEKKDKKEEKKDKNEKKIEKRKTKKVKKEKWPSPSPTPPRRKRRHDSPVPASEDDEGPHVTVTRLGPRTVVINVVK